jgi:hypothetical protein
MKREAITKREHYELHPLPEISPSNLKVALKVDENAETEKDTVSQQMGSPVPQLVGQEQARKRKRNKGGKEKPLPSNEAHRTLQRYKDWSNASLNAFRLLPKALPELITATVAL